MNTELLRRVKDHILAEPGRLLMSEGIRHGKAGSTYSPHAPDWGESAPLTLPACGTVGCIAGWACLLGDETFLANYGENPAWWYIRAHATNLLGLRLGSPGQATALFRVDYWPADFKERYVRSESPRERAEILAERIEHFINTEE